MRSFVREPVAVIGISSLLPGAGAEPRDGDATWMHLEKTGRFESCRLADARIDVARFGIPPAQAPSIARLQLLVLLAVERCLHDAGYADRALPVDRTDVFTGSCFGLDRHFANALRVESAQVADDVRDVIARARPRAARAEMDKLGDALRLAFERRFAGSAHDRVGEMASTIPARIAAAFRLHGRTIALEAADVTSFAAIEHAVAALRADACDAAIVASGQRMESPLMAAALGAKGLIGAGECSPFAADGAGVSLSEGVGALLLKRLSTALRDGDRIYGSIVGVGAAHDARPGTFRYGTSIERRVEAIARACADGEVDAGSIDYVECAGSGVGADTRAELAAIRRELGGDRSMPLVVGSVKDRLGHSWAHAGMASFTRALLAMHRRVLPETLPGARDALDPHAGVLDAIDAPRPWPASERGLPRRAGVSGASFVGTSYHVVLEEYDSQAARRARAATPSRRDSDDGRIAIVAMGGCFADAPDVETFWGNLWSKRDTLRPLPEECLARATYFDPRGFGAGRSYTDVGSRVIVPEAPPVACRVPPLRYAAMDGAQRLALHVADEVRRGYARAGITHPPGRGLVAVATNLSLGRERSANSALQAGELEAVLESFDPILELAPAEREEVRGAVRAHFAAAAALGPASVDGWLASGIAALIASELGFDGVPLAVEAACASSLASIDLAVRGLRSRAYDFAIAGGVELSCGARELVLCSALRLLSRTKIAPFGARADGFSPGDGVGLFLLRRLDDAVRDGDRVLGVIRGIGASNDARSLIAPDVDGQVTAVRRAFAEVDFGPETVQYVEAHGTGTEVGDQTEVRSLAAVYGAAPRVSPLAVGSVKSMIGHTFAAAGSAGLLRVLLGLRARTIPPTLVSGTLHPRLPLHDIPAYVATEVAPWPAQPPAPRRAAVSSFGTGGINFHMLVEEHTRTS